MVIWKTLLKILLIFQFEPNKGSVTYANICIAFPQHYFSVKAVLLQAWSGPEGSRKLRFPDYMTTAQDGGKVVSLTHRPLLPPGNAPGTYFC